MFIYSANPTYKKLLRNYADFKVTDRAQQADIIVTDTAPLDTTKYSRLKCVVCPCTNTNHIKFKAGVGCVCLRNERKFLETITSTAEHTLYLMLALTKQTNELTFKRPKKANTRLSGKTLGIIGHGRVGKQMELLGKALGMVTFHYDIQNDAKIELICLLRSSNFITLHTSIKKNQQPILGEDQLLHVKDGSFIINTSRGEAIDEEALLARLARLGGFAADVLCGEPCPPRYREFKNRSNTIITPHVAGYTNEDVLATFNFCMKKLIKKLKEKKV